MLLLLQHRFSCQELELSSSKISFLSKVENHLSCVEINFELELVVVLVSVVA